MDRKMENTSEKEAVDQEGRDLADSPIVEVIAHLGFSTGASAETSYNFFSNTALFLANFKGAVSALVQAQSAPVPSGPGKVAAQFMAEYRGLRFSSADSCDNAVIGPEATWIQLQGPYRGGAYFRERFKGHLESLAIACKGRKVDVFALRHIDRIVPERYKIPFNEALSVSVPSPASAFVTETSEASITYPFSAESTRGRVLLRWDRAKGTVIFDSEIITDLADLPLGEPQTTEELLCCFDRLKKISTEVFLAFASDRLKSGDGA